MTITLGDGIAWLEAQPPDSLDGIFTDPPWGAGPKIMGQDRWRSLLTRCLDAGYVAIRPGGTLILWYGATQLDDVLSMISRSAWHLNMLILISHGPLWNLNEIAFVLGHEARFPTGDKTCFFPVGPFGGAGYQNTRHPCPRPPYVVAKILRQWFAPGQRIADPFAGSDTTGWAAGRIGLTCHSFEIDPVMYATAITRHAQQDLFVSQEA